MICPSGDDCRFVWTPFCEHVHSIDLERVKARYDVLTAEHAALTTEHQALTAEHKALTADHKALMSRHGELQDDFDVLQTTHKMQYLTLQQMRCDLRERDRLLQQQSNVMVLTTAARARVNDDSRAAQALLDASCQENKALKDELVQCYKWISQFAAEGAP